MESAGPRNRLGLATLSWYGSGTALRFAIDFRKLNDVTKKDAYSLPDIQTILDKLKGSRYFTSLDVATSERILVRTYARGRRG